MYQVFVDLTIYMSKINSWFMWDSKTLTGLSCEKTCCRKHVIHWSIEIKPAHKLIIKNILSKKGKNFLILLVGRKIKEKNLNSRFKKLK